MLIEMNGVHKTYQMGETTVHALRGVTLQVEKGEFLAIMGPSGSGKSTFMNMVGCLDTPDQGDYSLDGIEINTLTDDELASLRNRTLGFVFQQFSLLPRTTAIRNVELPLMYDPNSKKRHESALKALEKVGLLNRKDHHSNELSGGQQQRVAIARALVNDPPVILADEPTGNLDSRNGEEIMQLFQELNDAGKTVVLVTHDIDISLHAKRRVVFRDGKIISDEPVVNRLNARDVLASLPIEDDYDEQTLTTTATH